MTTEKTKRMIKEGKISSNWQTGLPTKVGTYLVCKKNNLYKHSLWYLVFECTNLKAWDTSIIAWQKIEPYEVCK